MMLGSKGILTPLIPDCSALCAPAILKNIHNSLIFLRKMATYSCFWRVPSSKILLQASLHRISDLLTLVSCYIAIDSDDFLLYNSYHKNRNERNNSRNKRKSNRNERKSNRNERNSEKKETVK